MNWGYLVGGALMFVATGAAVAFDIRSYRRTHATRGPLQLLLSFLTLRSRISAWYLVGLLGGIALIIAGLRS